MSFLKSSSVGLLFLLLLVGQLDGALWGKVEETKDNVKEKLGEAKDNVKEKLGEAKDNAKEKLGEAKDELKEKATETKDHLNENIEEHKASLGEKIGGSLGSLKEKISESVESLKERLGASKDSAKDKIEESTKGLKDTYEHAKEGAKDTYEHAKEGAKDTYEHTKNKFEQAKESAKDQYEHAKEGLKDKYEQAKDKSEQAKGKYERVKAGVKHKYEEVKEGVKDKYEEAKEGVKDKYEEAKEGVKNKYEQAKVKLAPATEDVKDKYEQAKDKLGQATEAVKDKYEQAKEAVKDKVEQVTEAAEDKYEQAKGKANDNLEESKEKLNKVGGDLKEATVGSEQKESFFQRAKETVAGLFSGGATKNAEPSLQEQIRANLSLAKEDILARVRHWTGQEDKNPKLTELRNKVEQARQDLMSRAQELYDYMSQTVHEQTKDAKGTLQAGVESTKSAASEGSEKVKKAVEDMASSSSSSGVATHLKDESIEKFNHLKDYFSHHLKDWLNQLEDVAYRIKDRITPSSFHPHYLLRASILRNQLAMNYINDNGQECLFLEGMNADDWSSSYKKVEALNEFRDLFGLPKQADGEAGGEVESCSRFVSLKQPHVLIKAVVENNDKQYVYQFDNGKESFNASLAGKAPQQRKRSPLDIERDNQIFQTLRQEFGLSASPLAGPSLTKEDL